MKKRFLALCMIMTMAVGTLAGCGSSSDGTTENQTKVFNMAISEMPEVLSPTDGTDVAMTYLQAMYERLYAIDADGEYHYYLADSCDVSPDGLTYTLHLRDDATWSDGTDITSEDVLFTIEYYQNYAQSVVSTLTSGYAATAIDEKTVEVVRETTASSFYSDLGFIRLMPSHVFEGKTDAVDGSDKLVGTEVVTSGPYVISEWNAGESMVLTAREDYYRGKANIETINMIVMPEANSKELAFDSGEISCLEITSSDVYDRFNTDDYNMTVYPAGKVFHMQYNPDGQEGNGLSDDERLAVELAIGRDEIAETAYGNKDLASPAYSCFASSQEYFDDTLELKQDVEQAKSLAETSGLTDKTITIIYGSGSEGEKIAVVLQQQLAAIGVQVQLQGYDTAAFYGRVFHVAFGATADSPEASDWDYAIGFDSGLYGEASSSMVTYSTVGFLGEAGSGLMLAAYTESDEETREGLFKKAQAEVNDSNMFIPLVETNVAIASQKNVKGTDTVKSKPIFLDYWTLDIE